MKSTLLPTGLPVSFVAVSHLRDVSVVAALAKDFAEDFVAAVVGFVVAAVADFVDGIVAVAEVIGAAAAVILV